MMKKSSRATPSYPKYLPDVEKLCLVEAIKLVPDLDFVAWVLHQARALKLKFPVRQLAALKPLFGGEERIRFEGHVMNWKQVSTYLRKEYFPIEDEATLVRIVQTALAARMNAVRNSQISKSLGIRSQRNG
jgi:hypothetical protein